MDKNTERQLKQLADNYKKIDEMNARFIEEQTRITRTRDRSIIIILILMFILLILIFLEI